MTARQMDPTVDRLVEQAGRWREAFAMLRDIVLDCGLTEGMKWGQPCYMLDGGNIVLIHGFKDYCALLFFKGALMRDPDSLLIQQTEAVQAGRQIRFTDTAQIAGMTAALKAYVGEAVAVEQAGLQVAKKTTAEYPVPEEFQAQLDARPELRAAFEALTPGRQRGYLLHFAGAKQSQTRAARVEKQSPRILAGKGLDD